MRAFLFLEFVISGFCSCVGGGCTGVARAIQNTVSLFGGVQKEKWYFGIPKRKRRFNRTLAWARSVLTSANARGSSAYDVTQTTRCDGVEVWTVDARRTKDESCSGRAKALSPRPRLLVSCPRPASSPPGGAGGRREAPPARGVPRGQRNDPWSLFLSGSTRFGRPQVVCRAATGCGTKAL